MAHTFTPQDRADMVVSLVCIASQASQNYIVRSNLKTKPIKNQNKNNNKKNLTKYLRKEDRFLVTLKAFRILIII